jgi:hypothetical protein
MLGFEDEETHMADSSGYPNTEDDTSVPRRGLSRWQKVVGIIGLAIILLFVVVQVIGIGGGIGDH